MNQRVKIAVIAAVVFGFIAAYGTYNFLRQNKAATEAMKNASQNIVVAAKDVPPGTAIDDKAIKGGMLKEVAWPKASVPHGSFSSTQQLMGKVVKAKVVAGEPLLESRITGEGMGLTVRLTAGHRAMSVKVDEIIGVSGFISPDDRVDVIGTVAAPGRTGDEKISKIVLQDKRVLSVAQNVEQKDGKAVVARSITLEVTPEEAERLTLVQLEGQTILALRPLGDQNVVSTRGIMTRDILSAAAATPKHGALVAAAPDKYRVEVYLGNKKSVAEF
jgi:pilus assembly protein CpaB